MYSSSRVVHELSSKQVWSGATRVGTDTDVGESGVEGCVAVYISAARADAFVQQKQENGDG